MAVVFDERGPATTGSRAHRGEFKDRVDKTHDSDEEVDATEDARASETKEAQIMVVTQEEATTLCCTVPQPWAAALASLKGPLPAEQLQLQEKV